MSTDTDSLRFITAKFKDVLGYYNTLRSYKEGLFDVLSSDKKEVVVSRNEISSLKEDKDREGVINCVQLEYSFTQRDVERLVLEIYNVSIVINVLDNILNLRSK